MKEQLMERLQRLDRKQLMERAAVLRAYAEDAADAARDCAGNAAQYADEFVGFTMKRARGFDFWDFAILKLCLICFGAWLASAFTKVAQKLKPVFLIGFLAGWFYLIWRIFFYGTRDE